ncbi:hypothetical protein G7Z17_g1977 [Cylindrodendrum hubeiense]|uniref:AB hydrolase-1 domain-containing protein n=1 Tax=Cylindrodendrum hubeiense TaxID=595255 RepID=A0A9P5HLT6_9HYPO|nr:hypothetical protein G7Z17_g1977 [Cylindrodendrum hubeiense]
MDHWDPAFVNRLAAKRHVILIDNAGIGRSEGQISDSAAGTAQVYIDAIRAIGFNQVDVLGFSLGGAVAQMVALNAPDLVRRLVLASTAPSVGEGLVLPDFTAFGKLKEAETLEQHKSAFLGGFFASTEKNQAIGQAAWQRITSARRYRNGFVDVHEEDKQADAFTRFLNPDQSSSGSYDRLHELKLPVLVINGGDDILMPTENSLLLFKKLKGSAGQLHLFPDSGHGFLFQYPENASSVINNFLDQ